MKYKWKYALPFGSLTFVEENGQLCAISFGEGPADAMEQETPVIREAGRQFAEYADGKRKTFDLPLAPLGTEFQKKVWAALVAIPYGETRSYKQIAQQVGNPAACRAVGMANNKNPLPIVVPCHRVVGTNGSLTGYAGGLEMKEWLLALEGATV